VLCYFWRDCVEIITIMSIVVRWWKKSWNLRTRFFDFILTSAEWPPKNNNVYTFAFHPREGQFSFNHLGLKMESISNLVSFEIITYGSISTVMYNKENKKTKQNDCNKIYRLMYIDQSQFLHFSDWNLPFVMSFIDFWLLSQFKLRNENKKSWVTLSQKALYSHFYMIENLPFVVNWLNSWLISHFKTKKCKHKSWVILPLKVLFSHFAWLRNRDTEWIDLTKVQILFKIFCYFFHYSCVPYLEL